MINEENKQKEKNTNYLIIIRSIIMFFVYWFSAYLQLIPIKLFKITSETVNKNPNISVLLSLFSTLIVFIIILIVYRKDLIKEFKLFKNNFITCIDTGFKYWFIGVLIMFACNIILAFGFKSGGANNENLVQSFIKTLPILMGIDICLIGPFVEEIIFRKTIKDVFKNKWIFVALSFLLFGGAHVISNAKTIIDWLYIIPYGALGASFAYSYHKTDTVFTSMSIHMIHNTILFLLSVFVK